MVDIIFLLLLLFLLNSNKLIFVILRYVIIFLTLMSIYKYISVGKFNMALLYLLGMCVIFLPKLIKLIRKKIIG